MTVLEQQSDGSGPRVSGRVVVLCIIGFAVTMTSLMIGYWEAYTRPFRELQIAINERFPGSSPRVIGGRHRSGRDGEPSTLRVLVYVDDDGFNPEDESARRTEMVHELVDLSARFHGLAPYDLLEIRIVQALPEEELRRWDIVKSPAEWRKELAAAGYAVDHWPSTTANSAVEPVGRETVSESAGSE